MPLYENNSSIYQDGYELRQMVEHFYLNYSSANAAFQAQANLDLNYYAGDQSVWNNYYGPNAYMRQKQYIFNLIKKYVETPGGHQRNTRKSTIAIPVGNSDQHTADQFSKMISFIERDTDFQSILSDAFTYGSLITGLNFIAPYLDYTEDPVNGDIKFERIPATSVYIDPYWTKMDLSDCNFILRRQYFTPTQVSALLPEYRKEIMAMKGGLSRDGKFQYVPQNFNFDMSNLLTYDEVDFLAMRERKTILDVETGDSKEWYGPEDELRWILSQSEGRLKYQEDSIPTVKQGILVNGHPYYDGENLMGVDYHRYTPLVGHYSPELPNFEWRCTGIVRPLRDPQFLFNRRQVISLDILESVGTSGYFATEGSVIDPESLYKTGQGIVIWRKKGSSPDDVQKIPPQDLSPAISKMTEDMAGLLEQISGQPKEAFGMAEDDIPGVLAIQRQGAGAVGLKRLFDNCDLAQQIIWRKTLPIIQKHYTPSKIQRIIQEEPSQEFNSQTFGRYDVVIEEGIYSTTQKQQQAVQLMQMRQAGMNIPEEFIIKQIPLQNKEELIEAMQQAAQAQQQQQQQLAQVQMEEQKATIEMANAQAEYQRAGTQERLSEIIFNEQQAVERSAEAEKDLEQAFLNKVKGLKEIETMHNEMNLSGLERSFAIARQLKQDTIQEEQQRFSNTLNLSDRLTKMRESMSSAVQPPAQG